MLHVKRDFFLYYMRIAYNINLDALCKTSKKADL